MDAGTFFYMYIHSIISHVPNKNAFIHYFNRLPLQWQVCVLAFCARDFFFVRSFGSLFLEWKLSLVILSSAFGSAHKHLDSGRYITNRQCVRLHTCQVNAKMLNTMRWYILWLLWRKIVAMYQSVCVCAMFTCLFEILSLWSWHKWRWLFYCNGRIICCRSFLSSV